MTNVNICLLIIKIIHCVIIITHFLILIKSLSNRAVTWLPAVGFLIPVAGIRWWWPRHSISSAAEICIPAPGYPHWVRTIKIHKKSTTIYHNVVGRWSSHLICKNLINIHEMKFFFNFYFVIFKKLEKNEKFENFLKISFNMQKSH